MACFRFPDAVCNELNATMARFWWGDGTDKRKIHWMSWEKMVEKKSVGGLGLRDISCFNLAMLAKFGWRLLTDGASSLVARVLKARYYPNTTFLSVECSANPSWAWRSVLAGRIILQNGARWRVGNGVSKWLWILGFLGRDLSSREGWLLWGRTFWLVI